MTVELSEEQLEDLGDEDYILYRIQNELNVQYNTRKQLVLKAMYAYIAQKASFNNIDSFSIYGTNSFNLVWEKVCAQNFGNVLNVKLSELPLGVCDDYKESKPAKRSNWIIMLCMFFFNSLINMFISQQAQPRLLSISSSFFKKDASISACIRFALSSFNSAFSFSTSERVSSGLHLPRLSCSPAIPLASYLIV